TDDLDNRSYLGKTLSREARAAEGSRAMIPMSIMSSSIAASPTQASRRQTAAYQFYEFFAGGGMARAGLGTKWECLLANDIDSKKATSYAANWGGDALRVADVAVLSSRDFPGAPDLVWSSFPCQDLSLAGGGAGLRGERSG